MEAAGFFCGYWSITSKRQKKYFFLYDIQKYVLSLCHCYPA